MISFALRPSLELYWVGITYTFKKKFEQLYFSLFSGRILVHLRKIAETHLVNLSEGLRTKFPDSDQIQTLFLPQN